MNCKTLFHGSLSLEKLEKSSPFVRKAICSALWDESDRLGLSSSDSLELFSLWKSPVSLYRFLKRKNVNCIDVVEQYESSRLRDEDCNVVVRFTHEVFCKTYVTNYL